MYFCSSRKEFSYFSYVFVLELVLFYVLFSDYIGGICDHCRNPILGMRITVSERKRNTQVSEFTLYSFSISLFRRQIFVFGFYITHRNAL
jgi:hypothetical protein